MSADSLDTNSGRAKSLPAAAVGAADQALQAAVSFGIAALFITFSDPREYALYVIAINGAALIQAFHAALVLTPMQAVVSPMPREAALSALWGLKRMSIIIAIVGSVLIPVGFIGTPDASVALVAATMLFSFSTLQRVRVRTENYTLFRAFGSLKLSIVYASLAALGTGIFTYAKGLSATTALLLLSIAALGAISMPSCNRSLLKAGSVSAAAKLVRPYWVWTILGGLAAWLQTNIYLVVAYFSTDLTEIGNIAAARVLLMPVTLFFAGASISLRPHFSRWLYEQNPRALRRNLTWILLGSALIVGSYVAIVGVAIRALPPDWVPHKFVDASGYIGNWLVDAVAVGLYSASTISLVAARRFKALAVATLLSSTIGLTCAALYNGNIVANQVVADMVQMVIGISVAWHTVNRRS